jgi:hypothetical protein
MNKLERRFKIECAKNPYFSTLINLGHVVEYQSYSRHVIAKGINSLVDEDDYSSSDLEAIIEHLLSLSHSKRPPKDGSK